MSAYFQYGFPIYSAKALRFRLGHPKLLDENNMTDDLGDEKFIWTYTSPEYPMIQVSCIPDCIYIFLAIVYIFMKE